MKLVRRLSAWSLIYSITMALACLLSFWIMTLLLNPMVAKEDDLLGGNVGRGGCGVRFS